MQKEQFEHRIKLLLPECSPSAMEEFELLAKELEDEDFMESTHFYDSLYVELSLIKRDHGEKVATKLFNYGEKYTFSPHELRGAARYMAMGWSTDKISEYKEEHGWESPFCEYTPEEEAESQAILWLFQKGIQRIYDLDCFKVHAKEEAMTVTENERQSDQQWTQTRTKLPADTGNQLVDAFIRAEQIEGCFTSTGPGGPWMDCRFSNGVHLAVDIDPYIFYGTDIPDPNSVDSFTVRFVAYTMDENRETTIFPTEEIEKLLASDQVELREIGATLKEMTDMQFEINAAELNDAGKILGDREALELRLGMEEENGFASQTFGGL